MHRRRPARVTLLLSTILALATSCAGDSTAPPPVASITLEVVTSNPRVGETAHVGATPVDKNGRILNVPCRFASGSPGIATVDSTNGTVAALSPGNTVITVTCGGVVTTTTITVRPRLVTLTITKLGAAGSIFADPIGPTYDQGTVVTLTATPLNGSTFTGWGGACAPLGANPKCQLLMNVDAAVTGTFALVENFSGAMTSGSAALATSLGCRYSVSVSGPLTIQLTENSDFTVTGMASLAATVKIDVTGSPAGVRCTSQPFNTNPSGAITGIDANLTATLSDGVNFRWPITATRSGSTITGKGTISETLHDDSGVAYPVSLAANFTIMKQ